MKFTGLLSHWISIFFLAPAYMLSLSCTHKRLRWTISYIYGIYFACAHGVLLPYVGYIDMCHGIG